MIHRRLPFGAMMNLRDIGGYPAANGAATVFGRFLRGDAPSRVSDAEADALRGMGVTTVIDLRSDDETQRTPSALQGREGFDTRHIGLIRQEGFDILPSREEDVPGMYIGMADNHAAMRGVMRAMAGAPSGVLFHCTAGKDRTGVTAALLLLLAGVSETDIVADYQVSYTYIRPMILAMKAKHADMPAFLGHSKPEYMEGFLAGFAAQYGTAERYLSAIGLGGAEIAAIRGKLVSP